MEGILSQESPRLRPAVGLRPLSTLSVIETALVHNLYRIAQHAVHVTHNPVAGVAHDCHTLMPTRGEPPTMFVRC